MFRFGARGGGLRGFSLIGRMFLAGASEEVGDGVGGSFQRFFAAFVADALARARGARA
jgi:hypothetical protein